MIVPVGPVSGTEIEDGSISNQKLAASAVTTTKIAASAVTVTKLSDKVGRTSTFIVAANDTSTLAKKQADYICDGTADNVQIQAAIDALPSAGGTVLLLNGTYSIDVTLTLTKSNVTLAGVGKSTKFVSSTNIQMWSISNVNNVVFKDIWFYGFNGTGDDNCILFTTCVDCAVYDCTFENVWTSSIQLASNSHRTIIKNCMFISDMTFAINITSGGGHGHLIESNYFTVCSYGVYSEDGEGMRIANNHFDNTGSIGVDLEAGSEHTVISDNVFTGGDTGLDLETGQISVIGNSFDSVGNTCIYMGTGDGSIVSGNKMVSCSGMAIDIETDFHIVSNNSVDLSGNTGIILVGAYNCVVIGNVVTNGAREGIKFSNSSNNIISNNTCIDNDSGDTSTYDGIYLYNNSDRNLISNNTCRTTTGTTKQRYGINISAATCDKNKIFGNMLYQNKTGAINDAGTLTETDHNQSA